MTHDAVRDISTNYTTVWIKELDPAYSGVYIDSFLLLIFGGIGWQVCKTEKSISGPVHISVFSPLHATSSSFKVAF